MEWMENNVGGSNTEEKRSGAGGLRMRMVQSAELKPTEDGLHGGGVE